MVPDRSPQVSVVCSSIDNKLAILLFSHILGVSRNDFEILFVCETAAVSCRVVSAKTIECCLFDG